MKYMGSKNRIAKHLLPIILKDRTPDQWYIEPFVGGANMIDKVDGLRLCSDSNEYLIDMFIALQNGYKLPELISEDDYDNIKNNKGGYSNELISYVGFSLSFGGKWWGGYRRDIANSKGDINNMILQNRRSKDSLNKQMLNLKDVIFVNKKYDELTEFIPNNSIIYCDPPYKGTTGYKDKFEHDKFYEWCKEISKNNKIFISEYNMPSEFECIWEGELTSTLNKNKKDIKLEKLFTI